MNNKGFTIIETLMVMAIMVIILTLPTINLLRVQNNSLLTKEVILLINNLRIQQDKAMKGFSNEAQGVYFKSFK
jgi:prepilin-type N-terminal cleavage/methylation domain-containing protein